MLITPYAAFGSPKPALPFYIWWYFHGISGLPLDAAGAKARAVAGLQSLLALTIYYCQAKDFGDMQRGDGYDNSSAIGRTLISLFPTAEPDTAILPAVLRYNIVVGRGSLITYIVISGITWLLCLFALSVGSVNSLTRKAKDTTHFPTLDHYTKCEVQGEDGMQISKEQFLSLNSLTLKQRMAATGKMKVKLVQVQQHT